MPNQISQFLEKKLNIAREELASLIKDYRQLDDDQRLEKSNIAFDQITSYVQIQRNQLFPLMHRQGCGEELFRPSIDVQEDMSVVMERALMLHVDEPDFTFYDNLTGMLAQLDKLAELDRQNVCPWLEQNLTEQQVQDVVARLQNETIHESVPAYRSSEKPQGEPETPADNEQNRQQAELKDITGIKS